MVIQCHLGNKFHKTFVHKNFTCKIYKSAAINLANCKIIVVKRLFL